MVRQSNSISPANLNDLDPIRARSALRLLGQLARVGHVTIPLDRSGKPSGATMLCETAEHLARCGYGRLIRNDFAGSVTLRRTEEHLLRLEGLDLDVTVGASRIRAGELKSKAPTPEIAEQAAALTRALAAAALESAKLRKLTAEVTP